jgi:hypothetical protein
MRKHLVIPDIQAKPGAPLNHCEWIGKYIADTKPDVVVNLGDHCDVTSLSSYDRGKLDFEGRRFSQDIAASDMANRLLFQEVKRRKKKRTFESHILYGNHENRIARFVQDNPEMEGFMSLDSLRYHKFYDEVHPFLEPVVIDGITYAHYFYNPLSGRPWGGMLPTRLKNIGFTFTMGHQQGLNYFTRTLNNGQRQHALVAGSCYLHDEKYLGPQAEDHWNGIVEKNNVSEDGDYDLNVISMETLCRRYEGMYLREFLSKPKRWYIVQEKCCQRQAKVNRRGRRPIAPR